MYAKIFALTVCSTITKKIITLDDVKLWIIILIKVNTWGSYVAQKVLDKIFD